MTRPAQHPASNSTARKRNTPDPTCLPCGNKIPGFADALAAAHARGVAEGRERGSCDLRADEIATARAEGAAEALLPIRRFAKASAITAKALGRNDRDFLDLLILCDNAAAQAGEVRRDG